MRRIVTNTLRILLCSRKIHNMFKSSLRRYGSLFFKILGLPLFNKTVFYFYHISQKKNHTSLLISNKKNLKENPVFENPKM